MMTRTTLFSPIESVNVSMWVIMATYGPVDASYSRNYQKSCLAGLVCQSVGRFSPQGDRNTQSNRQTRFDPGELIKGYWNYGVKGVHSLIYVIYHQVSFCIYIHTISLWWGTAQWCHRYIFHVNRSTYHNALKDTNTLDVLKTSGSVTHMRPSKWLLGRFAAVSTPVNKSNLAPNVKPAKYMEMWYWVFYH